MPFKGFNKCGRCRKAGRSGIYSRSELRLEIVKVTRWHDKKLKVTCPYGHSWYSKSNSANRYIWRGKEENKMEERAEIKRILIPVFKDNLSKSFATEKEETETFENLESDLKALFKKYGIQINTPEYYTR